MKKINSLVIIFFALLLLLCGCSNESSALTEEITPEIEAAVSEAILKENDNTHYEGECPAEGHIIFGMKTNNKTICVYTYMAYVNFGFENGNFVDVSGCQMPAVYTFDADTYELLEAEYPEDGATYSSSIKKLFPKKYRSRLGGLGIVRNMVLDNQLKKYAHTYLKSIDRKAKVGSMRDFEYPLLTDSGVSVDVSNALGDIEKNAPYPYWIGNKEILENGVRFVYQMDYDKEKKLIIYSKYKYNHPNTIEEKIVVDALTGKIINE